MWVFAGFPPLQLPACKTDFISTSCTREQIVAILYHRRIYLNITSLAYKPVLFGMPYTRVITGEHALPCSRVEIFAANVAMRILLESYFRGQCQTT